MKQDLTIGLALSMFLSCAGPCAAAAAAESSFYKGPGLFSTRPSETASVSSIDRFGPVGMGIELHQPAFVMKIKDIEAGSPAAAAGKLKAGQTIETINGQKLADIDPRFQLAKIITDAEAADGVIKFMIKDKADSKAEEVIVKIPVLGAYSNTWPLNCPKSDKIVRAYGDFLAKKPTGGNGLEGFQLLFLLSTGEDKDLETARKWVKAIVAACKGGGGVSGYAWHIGIAGTPLPYKRQFLSADPNQLGPELQKAVIPIIRDQLIYEFIGQNRRILLGEVDRTKQSTYGSGHIDLLVDLYQRIGVHDYDWHNFGPDLRNEQWDYFMFVPKEKQAYDISPWRYRNVTYPAGMEKWQAVDFNPKTAGWKTGMPPFGQFAGKLVIDAKPCSNSDCYCKTPMRTLWDKEVLLVHKTFKVPPLQTGHLYRIRTGQGQHVGSGDGYRIYINGKLLVETKDGNGKRTGGKPRGGFITREFAPEFSKGEITVAATTFLRYGNKGIVQMPPVPQGIFSIWIEEMKVPPINDEAVRKSATSIAMLSSEWQDKQNPDSTVVQGDDDKFSYDGKFVANPKLLGAWTAVEQVKTIDEFNPGKTESTRTAGKTGKAGKSGKAAKNTKAARGQIAEIAFKDNGLTSDGLIIWSGNTMMDLNRYEALKMTVKTIDGTDYLFIEAGGFSAKNPAGWKSPLNVMKKQAK